MHGETQQRSLFAMQLIVLSVIGSSLFWAWAFAWSLSGTLFPPGLGNAHDAYVASTFSYMIAAVVLVMLYASGRFQNGLPKANYITAIAFTSTLVEVLTPYLPVPSFFMKDIIIGCGIVNGTAQLYLSVVWGARYTAAGNKSFFIVVISFLVTFVILSVIELLPYPSGAIIVLLCPLCSALLWTTEAKLRIRQSATTGIEKAPDLSIEALAGDTDLRLIPWKVILVLSVVGFFANLFSYFNTSFASAQNDAPILPAFMLAAALCVIYLAVKHRADDHLDLRGAYLVLMPTFTFALLLIIFHHGSVTTDAHSIMMGCAFLLHVVIWTQLSEVSIHTGMAPIISFSVGGVFVTLLQVGGGFTARALNQMAVINGNTISALAIASVIVLMVLVSLLLNRNPHNENVFVAEDASIGPVEEPRDAKQEEKLHSFCEQFGLSDRESQVCGYLLRGRNIPWIAEELYITTGTVKSHSSRIFSKTGVESRQQLIDLFEKYRQEDAGG